MRSSLALSGEGEPSDLVKAKVEGGIGLAVLLLAAVAATGAVGTNDGAFGQRVDSLAAVLAAGVIGTYGKACGQRGVMASVEASGVTWKEKVG